MQNPPQPLLLILKTITLAMSVASLSMGILKTASLETHVTLLVIAMFTLALATLLKGQEPA